MATIAKGMITLSSVNDAYSVSLSPSSCVINAKWNGENPDYSNAFSDISVFRGDEQVDFEVSVIQTSNVAQWSFENTDSLTKRIRIENVESGQLTASVKLQISVGSDFSAVTNFPVTVVRETSMLHWILEWENRGDKTEIAGEWIITPKIFVGKSENGGQLTGTYIGPDFNGTGKTGVFGYSGNKEIFHLDNTGGMIGGWDIQDGGIQTSDGTLKILSEGTIVSAPDGVTAWSLNKDGSAVFAGGNVSFQANGDAFFEGTINSKKGNIGGWGIGNNSMYSYAILISGVERYIGIRNAKYGFMSEPSKQNFVDDVQKYGGVSLFYDSNNSFGIEGYTPSTSSTAIKVFSLGSSNTIAGWHFNEDSLWSGEDNEIAPGITQYARVNFAGKFTTVTDAITIGSKGIRGNCWRLDCDGSGALANGQISWDKDGAVTFGNNVTLSWSQVTDTESITLPWDQITGVDSITDKLTYIGATGIYTGTISADNIAAGTISLANIRNQANTWYLNQDGSGALANGQIEWTTNGTCYFKGTLNGNNIIGAKITGGTITAVDYIKSESGSWQLNNDGSGQLANGKISWKEDGDVNVRGGLYADTLELAICTTMDNGFIDGNTGSFVSPAAGETATLIMPALIAGRARIFYLMIPDDNQKLRIGFPEENTSWTWASENWCDASTGLWHPENKYDEDGYATLEGNAGEWFMLVGIKTTKIHLQSLLSKVDFATLTASHVWSKYEGNLVPITRPLQVQSSSGTSANVTQTHWFVIPMSTHTHWLLMAAMGLNLG